MRFIRPLNYFLKAYSPMRLLRDFLRNCPAYTRADYVTPPPKIETRPTVYTNETYENRPPGFGNEGQLYGRQQEIGQYVPHMTPHSGRSPLGDMPGRNAAERSYLSDEERIDMAIEAVKNGLIPISFEHDPEAIDDDPYAEPFDAPFDEPFDPSVGYPTPAETLDDRAEEAYGDVADVQDDMHDDPYAEQSLDDIVDDPMDEPDDMPEPEPEPEPMDPMDDPLHPYMPYGGFPFPFGG